MTYDWTVRAIGPFEMTEYLGIAGVYAALAVTAPSLELDGRFDRPAGTFRAWRP
jgi:hypothetical protein